MREVWELMVVEYRKILRRKSTWIAVALLLLVAGLNPVARVFQMTYYDGEPVATQREWMQLTRQKTNEVAGTVDAVFLDQVEQSVTDYYYRWENERGGVEWYRDAYSRLMMPYDLFFDVGPFAFSSWKGADVDAYYQEYDDYLQRYYGRELEDQDMEDFLAMSRRNQPFTYGWMYAYDLFCGNQLTIGLFSCLAVAVCLSGMFAGETAVRMDALILSARYGKKQVLKAKLLCGISFSVIAAACITLIHFIICGATNGFEGANLPAQMYFPFAAWNLTVGQLAWIVAGCTLLATVLTGCLSMTISAYAKTPVPVLVIMFLFLIVPMFYGGPGHLRVPAALYDLLPTQMLVGDGGFAHVFRVGDAFVTGWQYSYPVYFLVCAVLVTAAYQGYKHRQVGG